MAIRIAPLDDNLDFPEAVRRRQAERLRDAATPEGKAVAAVATQQVSPAIQNALAPAADIIAYGDSMTAGTGSTSGNNYPALVARRTGLTVTNAGNYGEASSDIAARQGGSPLVGLPSGGAIPASGPVALTLKRASDGQPTARFIRVSPKQVNPVTFAGVQGTLAWESANSRYLFTRQTAGDAVPVTRPMPLYAASSTAQRNKLHLIWMGRNNQLETDQIAGDIASMIQHMDAVKKRYLILSVLTATDEPTGSANHAAITDLNLRLARQYGRRFVDLRRYLIDYGLDDAQISPTAEDAACIAADTLPPSLAPDKMHLNDAGYAIVANLVAQRLEELGWATNTPPKDPAAGLYSLPVGGYDRRYAVSGRTEPDGTALSEWVDLAGGDDNLTASGSPTLQTTAGHRHVSLNSYNHLAGATTPRTPGTVALMVKLESPASGQHAIELAGYRIRSSTGTFQWQLTGVGSSTVAGSTPGGWTVVLARLDGANSKIMANGVAASASSVTGPAATGVSLPIKTGFLAARAEFAELVYWPSALSDAEMSAVSAAMQSKYAALLG